MNSAEEQRKYKERQSVSFMYQKPPGMDSGVAKAKVCLLWATTCFAADPEAASDAHSDQQHSTNQQINSTTWPA